MPSQYLGSCPLTNTLTCTCHVYLHIIYKSEEDMWGKYASPDIKYWWSIFSPHIHNLIEERTI